MRNLTFNKLHVSSSEFWEFIVSYFILAAISAHGDDKLVSASLILFQTVSVFNCPIGVCTCSWTQARLLSVVPGSIPGSGKKCYWDLLIEISQ